MPNSIAAGSWIHRRDTRPNARVRLFCLPYAGGGTSLYRSWSEQFPAGIEVCAVQLPGRDERLREPPLTDIHELVEAAAKGLAPALDRPFAFFGYSMGALIAYELVRHLRGNGAGDAVSLFACSRLPPQLPQTSPPCHNLPERLFIEQIVNRYNGIPRAVLQEPDLMRLFMPTLRADFQLFETYRWAAGRPLDSPITAFTGRDDHVASSAELVKWKELTNAAFEMHILDGGHFLPPPSVSKLIQLISHQLQSAGWV